MKDKRQKHKDKMRKKLWSLVNKARAVGDETASWKFEVEINPGYSQVERDRAEKDDKDMERLTAKLEAYQKKFNII